MQIGDGSLAIPARSRPWLAVLRISELFLVTIFLYTLMRTRLFGRSANARFAIMAHWDARWGRCVQKILGFKLISHGAQPPRGVLLTPNHTGYMDIFALSALLPVFFVPKAE